MLHKNKIPHNLDLAVYIAALTPSHHDAVIALANSVHGAGYLSAPRLSHFINQGIKAGINASAVALLNNQVVGYRLSFAPGCWQPDKWCSVAQWPVPLSQLAYFKSVAIAPELQGRGIGQALLKHSIVKLAAQGAVAGVAHLWRESPHNSAVKYFARAGASVVAIHENRWQHLSAQGYTCPRCQALCCCSAAEMLLTFTQ